MVGGRTVRVRDGFATMPATRLQAEALDPLELKGDYRHGCLQVGDIVIAVDGEPLLDRFISEAMNPGNSSYVLSVLRSTGRATTHAEEQAGEDLPATQQPDLQKQRLQRARKYEPKTIVSKQSMLELGV